MLVVQENYGRGWDDEPYRLWPPQQRSLNTAIPDGLRATHSEARVCFDAKAYRAAVVMVRRALEGVCVDHGVRERDLSRSLTTLNEQGMIEGRLLEWAQGLRVLGNAGAHYSDSSVGRQDAEDALDLCEALLDYVYVFSNKFEKFKERRSSS
ncbi:DUF4145 domain-containing protein [Actinoplanes sp. NPDC049265]|uniref:DUF4145 domain-containing protein n=1 Tax=Actinoplanes sp. NPDC049265 TaxID=3363902 RepID=UPI00371FCCED